MKIIELQITGLNYHLKADNFSMSMKNGVKTKNLVLLRRNEKGEEEVISNQNHKRDISKSALHTSIMAYLMEAKNHEFLYVHPNIKSFKENHCKVITTLNENNIYKEFFSFSSLGIEKYPLLLLTDYFVYYASPTRLDEKTTLSYLRPDTPIDKIDDITVVSVKTSNITANGDFGIISLYDTLEEIHTGKQKIIMHAYKNEEDWQTFLQTNNVKI